MRRRRYSDELYHFGIKGMKWGVRRFQRKDGSLTPAGRKHIKTNPSYDADKEARKAKIKKYAKRAAIGVGATAAAVGLGYLAYKNRDKLRKPKVDPILETLKKQDAELNSILKTQKENRKKLDSAISAAEERLHGQSTYGDSRLDAIAKRQQFRSIKGGLRDSVPRTKVDRIQPDRINVDRIQPDREVINYDTLKAKYDKLSNAVSEQQDFLKNMNKKSKKKKRR